MVARDTLDFFDNLEILILIFYLVSFTLHIIISSFLPSIILGIYFIVKYILQIYNDYGGYKHEIKQLCQIRQYYQSL